MSTNQVLLWTNESYPDAPWGYRQEDGRIGLVYPSQLNRGFLIVTKDELLELVRNQRESPWAFGMPGEGVVLGNLGHECSNGKLNSDRKGLAALAAVVLGMHDRGTL